MSSTLVETPVVQLILLISIFALHWIIYNHSSHFCLDLFPLSPRSFLTPPTFRLLLILLSDFLDSRAGKGFRNPFCPKLVSFVITPAPHYIARPETAQHFSIHTTHTRTHRTTFLDKKPHNTTAYLTIHFRTHCTTSLGKKPHDTYSIPYHTHQIAPHFTAQCRHLTTPQLPYYTIPSHTMRRKPILKKTPHPST